MTPNGLITELYSKATRTAYWTTHKKATSRLPFLKSNMLEKMIRSRYRNEKMLEKPPVTRMIIVTTKVSMASWKNAKIRPFLTHLIRMAYMKDRMKTKTIKP